MILFFLYAFLFFMLGVISHKAALQWLNEKTWEFERAVRIGTIIVVFIGFFYVAGPGGWVYRDFENYANQVVCISKNWDAIFYPYSFSYPEYNIKLQFGNVTINMPNTTALAASDFLNQSPPAKPEDDVFYKVFGNKTGGR